ncbi:MAG: hypothetical protein IRZ15_11185 [Bryobacteraceae bacterium]|nr:hypothetical protein [Bryobacteraceae bacterium]
MALADPEAVTVFPRGPVTVVCPETPSPFTYVESRSIVPVRPRGPVTVTSRLAESLSTVAVLLMLPPRFPLRSTVLVLPV